MRNSFLTLLTLLTANNVYTSGIGDNANITASTSTSSTSSTSSTALALSNEEDQTQGIPTNLFPVFQIVSGLERCTKNNIEQTIDDFGPAHQIFFSNVFLKKGEEIDPDFATQMIEATVFSYLFLIEMSGETQKDIARKYKSLLDKIHTYKTKLNKKQKDFLKLNFKSTPKIKNIRKNKLIAAFFPKDKQRINDLFEKFKHTVREYCEIESTNHALLFNTHDMENNRKLLELAALFGVHSAVSKLDVEYDTESRATAKPLESKALFRLSMLLRFSGISYILNNHYLLLNNQKHFDEAHKWKFYADPNAQTEITKFDNQETQDDFLKAMFGEQGLESFFKTATKSKLEPNQHLEILQQLVDVKNPDPKDMLKYAEKLVEYKRSKVEAKEWAVKAAEAGTQKGYALAAKVSSGRNKHAEALAYLLKITDESEKTADYYYNLGLTYSELGNLPKAKEHLNIAVRQKHILSYLALADIEEETTKKKVYLNLCLAMIPENDEFFVRAHIQLAYAYLDEKKFEEARKHFQICIDHGYQIAYAHMGLSFVEQENFQEAIPYFSQALEADDLKRIEKAHSHYYLGLCYLKCLNIEDAIISFKKSCKAGYMQAFLELAKIYAEKGDIKTATRYFERAIKKNVKDARKHYFLFLAKQKNEEGAKEQAEYIQADLIPVHHITHHNDNDDNDREEIAEYVDVVDTKKYRQMLAEIEREMATSKHKPLRFEAEAQDRSYQDIEVSFAHPGVKIRIEHQQRVEELLYGLANGHRPGHLERLTGFKNRWSMRITQGNRLVFDIVEGTVHASEGVNGIVIVSAEGHYNDKDMKRDEFYAHTDIKAPWSSDDNDDNESE